MPAPKLTPALLGGLFIGVLSSLPIVQRGNVCCCLWVVVGGAIAAWLMQQNTPRPVTLGEGALVGLLAGLAGAVTMGLVNAGLAVVFGMPPLFDELRRGMESGARDAESRAFVEGVGPVLFIGVFFMMAAVASAVMATLGGLLGAVLFRRRAGGPPASPPPAYTPPTFTPPAPPPGSGPPVQGPPVMSLSAPPMPPPPLSSAPAEPEPEPYAGDAPTMLIPMRGPTLGPPAPPAGSGPPPPPAPPGPPAADREPESH
jgi:hypothetical protein